MRRRPTVVHRCAGTRGLRSLTAVGVHRSLRTRKLRFVIAAARLQVTIATVALHDRRAHRIAPRLPTGDGFGDRLHVEERAQRRAIAVDHIDPPRVTGVEQIIDRRVAEAPAEAPLAQRFDSPSRRRHSHIPTCGSDTLQ